MTQWSWWIHMPEGEIDDYESHYAFDWESGQACLFL